MSIRVPIGYYRIEYLAAQELMYEMKERQDALRAVIATADEGYKKVIEDRRRLLSRFPTLDIMSREDD